MEHRLEKIAGKPSDYKQCTICGNINWYEREECIHCGDGDLTNEPLMTHEQMDDWIKEEVAFWIEVENYTEEEAYNVIKEI